MKKVWVISLGGSRIVPDDVDDSFLRDFKTLIDLHEDKRFVVVCGGGRTARRYMTALKKLGKETRSQSIEGIAITRLHAGFMARLFGSEANDVVPKNMKKARDLLEKNRVVFCGALRWRDQNTSDGTAAKLAGFLKCNFINLTNVRGLYSSDPKKNKRAKFIPKIGWEDFFKIARRMEFKAGQHFVLDAVAAREIAKRKIVTYIVGSLGSMNGVLKGDSKVNGTVISG